MSYPVKTWEQYEDMLRSAGERRLASTDEAEFLIEIGLVTVGGALTETGQAYFDAAFINRDERAVVLALQIALRDYPPAQAISQRLFGVPRVDKSIVDSVLRNVGLGRDLTDRKLGTLLITLDRAEVIRYVRSKGELTVLVPPLDHGQVPSTVFVSRETPFSNVMWLGRVLKQCEGHIYWLDKHFQPVGLEALADVADGNRISEIRVLSLRLPDNSSSKAVRAYRALKIELANRGIAFEWRFVDSAIVRDSHDRWIIGSDSAYNVPDVGTVMSGNKSEMSASKSAERLNADFEGYWSQGQEVCD